MASVNKVILVGRLGKDPEVRYLPDGGAVCNITLATSETWKDKNTGDKQEKTEWHRVTFYRKLAEIAGEYLKKGREVYVEGRLETRKWTDKEGRDRYTTEIIANEMQMLGGRPSGGAEAMDREPRQGGADTGGGKPAGKKGGGASFEDMDDDIPF